MPAQELTPLERLKLNQHVNRLKALIRQQVEEALQSQEPRMRELLLTGEEVTVNLALEVVPAQTTKPTAETAN